MKFDVAIIGGGTAGCAAAYTAGRFGLKTLLVEKRLQLGGAITAGLVVPAMNAGKNQINTTFFDNLIVQMKHLGGQVTYQGNQGWFNPELMKIALDRMMIEADVKVKYEAEILSVYDGQIEVRRGNLSVPIETRYIIDATGDGEVAKLCGCTFLETSDEIQPAGLRFMMAGIDLATFGDWLLGYDSDRTVTSVEVIDGQTHLSSACTWDSGKKWALKPLFDDAVARDILKDEDRNYFQLFTVAGMPGTVAFNCPRLLTYNIIEGREALWRLSVFCKEYFPGFENAFISNISEMLGVRSSRRIKGKYIYTINDLRSGKKFDNPVLISDYPVDVHSAKRDGSTLEQTGEYQLPIESLMSADVPNLFMAGRCISSDFLSQGALRIQPNCFAMGEGVAKYIVKLCK